MLATQLGESLVAGKIGPYYNIVAFDLRGKLVSHSLLLDRGSHPPLKVLVRLCKPQHLLGYEIARFCFADLKFNASNQGRPRTSSTVIQVRLCTSELKIRNLNQFKQQYSNWDIHNLQTQRLIRLRFMILLVNNAKHLPCLKRKRSSVRRICQTMVLR